MVEPQTPLPAYAPARQWWVHDILDHYGLSLNTEGEKNENADIVSDSNVFNFHSYLVDLASRTFRTRPTTYRATRAMLSRLTSVTCWPVTWTQGSDLHSSNPWPISRSWRASLWPSNATWMVSRSRSSSGRRIKRRSKNRNTSRWAIMVRPSNTPPRYSAKINTMVVPRWGCK